MTRLRAQPLITTSAWIDGVDAKIAWHSCLGAGYGNTFRPVEDALPRVLERTTTTGIARAPESMILKSIITCPRCGVAKSETMPTDACRFYYECTGCGARLRPKPGDCCVFCSYGSVPCPPIQAQRSGETGGTCYCSG